MIQTQKRIQESNDEDAIDSRQLASDDGPADELIPSTSQEQPRCSRHAAAQRADTTGRRTRGQLRPYVISYYRTWTLFWYSLANFQPLLTMSVNGGECIMNCIFFCYYYIH